MISSVCLEIQYGYENLGSVGGVTKLTNESVITFGGRRAHGIADQTLLVNCSPSSTLPHQLDQECFHTHTFYFLM